MQPINKHTVLKQVRTIGEWVGYIAPNKVNGSHVNSGWHIGCSLKIINHAEHNKPYVLSVDGESVQELNEFISSFVYYNCNNELGKTVRFWVES